MREPVITTGSLFFAIVVIDEHAGLTYFPGEPG